MACGPAVVAARDPADHGVSSYTPWVEVERLLLPRAAVLCALACAVCAHVVSSLVYRRCVRALLCLLLLRVVDRQSRAAASPATS